MSIRFKGLVAPVDVPTGDGRMFAAGKITHRPTPFPLMAKFSSGGGHDGAVIIGKINRIYDGPGGYWAEGEFLDPAHSPEVAKAVYMLQQKVMGPSVDLDRDFTVQAVKHPTRPERKAGLFSEGNIIGITLVPMPAFPQVHLSVDTGEEKSLLASIGIDIRDVGFFAVNADAWKTWPLAPREYTFDADDAVKRIAYWAGIGSKEPALDKYASAFLWRNGNQAGDTLAQDSFRLPLCDIINNEPHLIYHAAYSAAALLSGAHGGLPNIPEEDKAAMVPVINEIYAALATAFNDPNLTSPFMEGVQQQQASIMDTGTEEDCGCSEMADVYSDDGSGGNTAAQRASDQMQMWQEKAAEIYQAGIMTREQIDQIFSMLPSAEYAAKEPYGDVKYADPGYRDGTKRYPIDTEEHCRAAWAYINQEKNASKYSPEELAAIKGRIRKAAEKYGIEISEESGEMSMGMEDLDQGALLASLSPLAPPAAWFANPGLKAPTKLTITDDGHVFGHLAQWKVCHVGIGSSCVMAPKTRTNYGYFKVGKVRCDDGSDVPIGKITLGTGHANAQYGVVPSREHYDNTGWAAAVVNVGEDRHGIWVSGALTTTMTPERVVELRQSPLSGDWRTVNGNLELIAALAVNNPGFPIYRESDNHAFSLVAVGIVDDSEEEAQFSMTDQEQNQDEQDYPADDVIDDAAELAARLARWNAIDEDLEAHQQARRAAMLAAITEEREVAAEVKTQEDPMAGELFAQYNTKLIQLQE